MISSLTALPFWLRHDPDASFGHAPAHHPRSLLRGFGVHTLMCRGSGLPLFFLRSAANAHDAPFAQRLLAWAMHLYSIRPRVIRLDAAYWGLRLMAWIPSVVGAVAVIPWNPGRRKNRSCLPPTRDQGRTGQTQRDRTLLWARFSLLWSPTPTLIWLVPERFTGCLDLHFVHHRRSGCPAGWPS